MVLHPNVLHPPQTLYTLGPQDAAQNILEMRGRLFHRRCDVAQNVVHPGHLVQKGNQRGEHRFCGRLRRGWL